MGTTKEISVATAEGFLLRGRSETPADGRKPIASVLLLHGLGEHHDGLGYRQARAALTGAGFAVMAVTLRGHGKSEGGRMFTPRWEVLRDDLQRMRAALAKQDDRPHFLIGLSLGGLLVLDQALHHPEKLAGVIAIAPPVGEVGAPWFLQAAAPLLAALVPRIMIPNGLDLAGMSRDPAAVAAVLGDPLFQAKTTPRLGNEILRAIRATSARAAEMRVPLLLVHGTDDRIARPAGTKAFFDGAGSTDKTWCSRAGAWHNLFIEPDRAETFALIAEWMRGRSGRVD